jgi:hypothetical protein
VAPGQVLSLSVTTDAADNPELFVVGLDHQVWVLQLSATGQTVGTYELAVPGQVTALSTGRDGAGNPEVFVVGLDRQVWGSLKGSGYSLVAPGIVKGVEDGTLLDQLSRMEADQLGLSLAEHGL